MTEKKPKPHKSNQATIGAGADVGQVGVGEHIVQIQNLNLGAARREDSPRFTIPAPSPVFVGRKRDVNRVLRQIDQGKGAAISGLAGMGGVGKTELARYVAHQLKDRYPFGCEVDLRGTSDKPLQPTEIMGQVIRAFARVDKMPEDENDVATIYRAVLQNKRALIVLDDAAELWQVGELVPAEGCAFLITSRTLFQVKGLTPIVLDVLKPTEAKQLLLKLCPRIGRQADTIAKLCGYLPLALEIAGSFLAERGGKDVSQYVEELKQRRLQLLKRKGHKNLNVEAAFAQTYEHLSVSEQTLWRLLGVFPSTFDGSAAGYVWGLVAETEKGIEVNTDKAENQLEELRRYSLLGWREGRYELHDLLRDYALQKMNEGGGSPPQSERVIARNRHSEFYFQVAVRTQQLYDQAGESLIDGLALFRRELANIRSGREWAAMQMQVDRGAAELCSSYGNAAWSVVNFGLPAEEQIKWYGEALAAARLIGDRVQEGAHIGNLGIVYRNLGEVGKAIEYYDQALAISKETGDRIGEGSDLGSFHPKTS